MSAKVAPIGRHSNAASIQDRVDIHTAAYTPDKKSRASSTRREPRSPEAYGNLSTRVSASGRTAPRQKAKLVPR